jgi:hypothetical protein
MIRVARLAAALVGCIAGPEAVAASPATGGSPSAPGPAVDAAVSPRPATPGAAAAGPTAASHWRTAYDWDGDGVKDEVVTRFTGGAHCCYLVGVKLAAGSKTIMLPFRLDGGLAPLEDLPSRPDRFSVVIDEGGLPEMVMEIETYDGKPGPLDRSWKRVYGISTHRIAVAFRGGKVSARDVTLPALNPKRVQKQP